ncbi:MobC family plasmid mobilization relaxosome protein [Methylophaga sp.]|uniref:MobC family plasmid mobilization relaxosome protein n=1 Tax=Methylophaga sp. TaxID=2024840 RepID=UPI003F7025DF
MNNKKTPNKDRQLKVRLTDHEYTKLEDLASAQGITKADYVRQKLDLESVKRSPMKKIRARQFTPVDPSLLRQITRIGNNLNQIARKANGEGVDSTLALVEMLLVIERRLRQVQDAYQIS